MHLLAGWISLHHAALLAPPTLVSHLLTHGCSPFAATRRNLTALDIVTGHSILPGREDVRLLLEEAMREEGWTGGRMEERRRAFEKKEQRLAKLKALQQSVGRILDITPSWWGELDADSYSDTSDDEDDAMSDDNDVYVSSPICCSTYCLTTEPFLDSSPGLHVYARLRSSLTTGHIPNTHYRFSA